MIALKYYLEFEKNYREGKYPNQRFGQAFLNFLCDGERSMMDPILDNEIYYSNDEFWVKKLLWENVIQFDLTEPHYPQDNNKYSRLDIDPCDFY